jgi:hypothetical protein
MWGFFVAIIESYNSDKGVIDQHMSIASVAIVNYMVKAPQDFANANLNGQSPL